MSKAYRPEIDGLRALAALSVTLYHAHFIFAGKHFLSGGFIGVDIFFVISGYLITRILIREFSESKFSYKNFYERRIRRLFPALLVVMLSCIPFAWLYLFPRGFASFAKSIVSTILFSSNIIFWREDGYAAPANDLKPLLHTWSLSVEEQYYILFPILLFLVWRLNKKFLKEAFYALFFLSLLLAEWTSFNFSAANFYFLSSRGWELFAGALMAKYELEGKRKESSAATVLNALGLTLLFYSFVYFEDTMRHPSAITLLPILGTVLLIWYSGGKDPVTRFLSSKPVVFLGLISYSFYLWHQPIFAFARLRSLEALSLNEKVFCLLLTFALAYLSWRFVEQPFRDKKKIGNRLFWPTTSIATIALLIFGLIGYQNGGFAGRIPQAAREALKMANQPWFALKQEGRHCFERPAKEACFFKANPEKTNWILAGDSHISAISQNFKEQVLKRGENLLSMNASACIYSRQLKVKRYGADVHCNNEYNYGRRERILSLPQSIVVLGGRLPFLLTGKPFDNGEGGVETAPRMEVFDENDQPFLTDLEPLKKLIKDHIVELTDKDYRVVLIYPIPEVGWDIPPLYARKIMQSGAPSLPENTLSTSYAVFKERVKSTYELYDAIPDSPNLLRIYPEKLFCRWNSAERCHTHRDSKVLYSDNDHLSSYGGELLVQYIIEKTQEKWGN